MWTFEDWKLMKELHRRGLSVEQMALEMGRTFYATRNFWRNYRHAAASEMENFFVEGRKPITRGGWATRKVVDEAPAIGEGDVKDRAERLKRASIMHLVDLKRAGHSPTKTEYRIETDGIRYVGVSFFDGSAVGSSAAMCAG